MLGKARINRYEEVQRERECVSVCVRVCKCLYVKEKERKKDRGREILTGLKIDR